MVALTPRNTTLEAPTDCLTIRLYLDNIRRTPGPFTDEDFDTSEEAASNIERMKVLSVHVELCCKRTDC